jgi:uncharacterized protein (TIGR00251 family)
VPFVLKPGARATYVGGRPGWQPETGSWKLEAEITITDSGGGAQFAVRVTPRAGRSAVAGVREGVLLVRLAAPPVDGAANEALVAFIAGLLDRPKRDVEIVAGQKSREKRVRVAGARAEDMRVRLSAILPA